MLSATVKLPAAAAATARRPTGAATLSSKCIPRALQLRQRRVQRSSRPVVHVQAIGPAPGSGLSPELKGALDEYVAKYKIVVFMKGTPQFPQCGFSNTVVQILTSLGAQFQGVNILEDDMLRQGLKEYSAWPTFPQVYIDGEFFGGCDIMIEEFQNGNLKETIERVMME